MHTKEHGEITVEEIVQSISVMDRLRRRELKLLEEMDQGVDEEEEIVADVMDRRARLKEMIEYLQGCVDQVQ